jgi:hypothetical protein
MNDIDISASVGWIEADYYAPVTFQYDDRETQECWPTDACRDDAGWDIPTDARETQEPQLCMVRLCGTYWLPGRRLWMQLRIEETEWLIERDAQPLPFEGLSRSLQDIALAFLTEEMQRTTDEDIWEALDSRTRESIARRKANRTQWVPGVHGLCLQHGLSYEDEVLAMAFPVEVPGDT